MRDRGREERREKERMACVYEVAHSCLTSSGNTAWTDVQQRKPKAATSGDSEEEGKEEEKRKRMLH